MSNTNTNEKVIIPFQELKGITAGANILAVIRQMAFPKGAPKAEQEEYINRMSNEVTDYVAQALSKYGITVTKETVQ